MNKQQAVMLWIGTVLCPIVWAQQHMHEPDQFRYNFESGKLDSYSARMTWNPTSAWSLQVSQGHLDSPEALEPETDLVRTTASAMYHRELFGAPMQTTVAWGRNHKQPGSTTDGTLLESAWQITERNTLFGRLERVENDELFPDDETDEHSVFNVTKLSLGGLHEVAMLKHANIGIGALVSQYRFPSALDDDYGSNPTSYMVFVRARLE